MENVIMKTTFYNMMLALLFFKFASLVLLQSLVQLPLYQWSKPEESYDCCSVMKVNLGDMGKTNHNQTQHHIKMYIIYRMYCGLKQQTINSSSHKLPW